jgi:site-specific DNA-cytosine methylase
MMTWSKKEKCELVHLKNNRKLGYSTICDKLGRDEADVKRMWQQITEDPVMLQRLTETKEKMGEESSTPCKMDSTPNKGKRATSPAQSGSNKKEDKDQDMVPAPETPPLRRLRQARSVSPEPCTPRRGSDGRFIRELDETPRTPVTKKRASSVETPEKKRKVAKSTEASQLSPAKKGSAHEAVPPVPVEVRRKTHRAVGGPYKDPAGLDPAELAIEGTVRRQVEKLQPLLEEAFKAGHVPKDFTIGTACSGTDSPILGIGIAKEAMADLLQEQGAGKNDAALTFKHVMSCEIEPFKQAFLARNYKDATIFPDLTKLVPEDGSNLVQTVVGGKKDVPSCWMFVTGTVCKDFSMRKTVNRLDLEDKGKSGNTFYSAVDYIWKHKPTFTIFENVVHAPWDKMAEFITGRVPVATVGKGKECGNVRGPAAKKVVTSKKTGADDNPDLLFQVLKGGHLEVIAVPRMAGVKLGQKLVSFEREGKKQKIKCDSKVGSEIPLEKLKKMMKIQDSDILIFEVEKHGFLAHHTKVDTAKFELPHTRNRGYMLVWHKSVGSHEIGPLWDQLLHGLESPVQYGLQHYLLPDDDERVRRVREVLRGPMGRRARDDNARNWNGDWWNSESKDVRRQVQFRKENAFDPEHRPMTGWNKDGVRKSQPQLWPELMGVVDSRQCDMMDCFAMDCAAETPPRDALHASYVWDISQNVDMTSSHNKPGVCGCLTPGGWLLFPELGRCMLGFEKLIVNGIPADRMLLGSETEVQLSDLAGNAMSLPVVLGCMLAALSVKELARRKKADKDYEYDFGADAIQKREQRQKQQQLPAQMQNSHSDAALALPALKKLAKMADTAEATSILCKCETSGSIAEADILSCSGCGMSICRYCAQFAAFSAHDLEERATSESRNMVPETFEKQLRQCAPQKLSIGHEHWGKHDYIFKEVTRDAGKWTLRYLAHDGVNPTADLRIHVGQLAIGAKDKGLKCVLSMFNTKAGKADVVARLVLPAGQETAEWEVQLPSQEKDIKLRGSNPEPSWRAEMTVGEYLNEKWPKSINVTDGSTHQVYERLPCRGTIAQGALWRCADGCNDHSFLYVNPNKDRTGPDNFQFAKYPSYKDADTCTFGKVDSEWVPSKALLAPEHKVKLSVPVWKTLKSLDVYALKDGLTVDHDVANEETRKQLVAEPPLKKAKKTVFSLDADVLGLSQHMDSPALVPICSVSGLSQHAQQRLTQNTVFQDDDWAELRVKGPGTAQTMRRFSDAVGPALLREGFSQDLTAWINLPTQGAPWGADPNYVPTPPREIWHERQRTYDPQESQEFERLIQTRPEVWKPRISTQGSVEVQVCPEAAAHRAAVSITRGNQQEATCSWRLSEPSMALESTPGAFHVPTSDDYKEAPTPMLFETGQKLYPRQARALARMQSVEAGEVEFFQEERSEHALPGVGWIFEAKAEVKCRIPGGVLADEMGAGKTVTTIALIAAGREHATKHMQREKHTTRATLIMAPPNLIDQWDDERKKFTGDNLKTVLLHDAAALEATSVQELMDADMVIASFELLSESKYMKNLQEKAGYDGLPELPSGSGHKEPERMRGIWIPGHPACVYGTAKGKQQQREEMAYFSAEYGKTIESLRKKELSPESTNAPLEWFQWNRIVVDEVHYAFCVDERESKGQRAAREMLGVSQPQHDMRPLRASSGIWGLTGTPMLSNEARVTEMAALMGGIYIMGAQQHWRGMERASLRDQFLLAQEPLPSTHYRAQSRAHAQQYVTKSCQRNRIEKDKLPPCKTILQDARFKSDEATAYKNCLVGLDIGTEDWNPEWETLSDVVRQKLLGQLATASDRGHALQQIIKQIHSNKGDHVKVAVFAADGLPVEAARKALDDASIRFTEFGDKDFRAFAQADLTDVDKAKPRVTLLTFEQAAGLNLQHGCSHIVLFAPLYTGNDPMSSCAKEQQAIGRVYRSGQKQDVFVHRIILKGPKGQATLDKMVLDRNTQEETIKAVTSD